MCIDPQNDMAQAIFIYIKGVYIALGYVLKPGKFQKSVSLKATTNAHRICVYPSHGPVATLVAHIGILYTIYSGAVGVARHN